MAKIKENLEGKVFTNLSVVRRIKGFWECKCICGNMVKVISYDLINGKTKSCGCFLKKWMAELGTSSAIDSKYMSGRYFSSLVKGARRRNLEFTITIEYAEELLEKQEFKCALSGIKLRTAKTIKEHKYNTASLDRIDSSKGYVKGNVQWVHKRLNRMKSSDTEKQFYGWCKMIYENNKDKYD